MTEPYRNHTADATAKVMWIGIIMMLGLLYVMVTSPKIERKIFQENIQATIVEYGGSRLLQMKGSSAEQHKWCKIVSENGTEIWVGIPAGSTPSIGDVIQVGVYVGNEESTYRFHKYIKKQ